MTIRTPSIATSVKLLRDAFQLKNVDYTLGEAYNLYARLQGFKNWAHFRKHTPAVTAAPFETRVTEDQIAGWPKWVMTTSYNEATGDEVLGFLPFGCDLDNRYHRYGSLLSDGFAELAVGLRVAGKFQELDDSNRASHLVLTEVHSRTPSIEKYGLPTYANDREVEDWAVDEMGWGVLVGTQGGCQIATSVQDSGDDSSGRYWAVLAVHPDVHVELVGQVRQAKGHWRFVRPDDTPVIDEDAVEAAVRKLFNSVFSDCNGASAGQLMENLLHTVRTDQVRNRPVVELNSDYYHLTWKELASYLVTELAQIIGSQDALGLPLDQLN
jgi:hypothetical protein